MMVQGCSTSLFQEAQQLLGDPDLVLAPEPLNQVCQTPADHPMHGQDRTACQANRRIDPLGELKI